MIPNKETIIHSMCKTWRHDFDLHKESTDLDLLTSGTTEEERKFLYIQMEQLYNHHIRPIVHELEELQNGFRLVSPQSKEHAEGMLRVANFYLEQSGEK